MKVKAFSRAVRISPTKATPLARKLRGQRVSDALSITKFSPQKAALLIGKTLRSAVANVENNAKLAAEDFRVEEVIVEQGPTMKRYWARSRGMVRPVTKRTSHIGVVLTNE